MEQLTMTVRDMAKLMNISLPTAYELVKTKGFPVIHVGNKILIPIDSFKVWLQKESQKNN